MVFLAGTKHKLKSILNIVKQELNLLNLQVKDNWQIFPVDSRGIDFLGYRFFHKYVLLRKSIKKKIFKRIGQYRRKEINKETLDKSMAAWNGWLIWCDSTRLYSKIRDLINKINIQNNESTK